MEFLFDKLSDSFEDFVYLSTECMESISESDPDRLETLLEQLTYCRIEIDNTLGDILQKILDKIEEVNN